MILQIILGAVALGVILIIRKLNTKKLDQSIPGRGPLEALFHVKTFRKDIVNAVKEKNSRWFRWAIVGQEALIATHPDSLKVRKLILKKVKKSIRAIYVRIEINFWWQFVLSNPDTFVKVKLPSLSREQDALFDGHILSANGDAWQ